VSLADKLDTIVGLVYKANERPTGSRDPFGLRRAAQGVIKILVDLGEVALVATRPPLGAVLDEARRIAGAADLEPTDRRNFQAFLMERVRHLMQVRGLEYEEIQAVTGDVAKVLTVSPADLFDWTAALGKERHTSGFGSVAEAFKRANNIVESAWGAVDTTERWGKNADRLAEPAELRLKDAVQRVGHEIDRALSKREPQKAFAAIGSIQGELATFFSEVRVMVDDAAVQDARLSLLAELRDRIMRVGDISLLAPRPS